MKRSSILLAMLLSAAICLLSSCTYNPSKAAKPNKEASFELYDLNNDLVEGVSMVWKN